MGCNAGAYAKSVFGNEEQREQQECALHEIAQRLRDEQATRKNCGGDHELLGGNLQTFLSSLKLQHCTGKLEQAGYSLSELILQVKQARGMPESLTRMLSCKAGIPIGAACKIVIAIQQALARK